jgi:choline dehydrogenase
MYSPTKVPSDGADTQKSSETADFIDRVRVNQQRLEAELKSNYDFIVCGSGSSGSVVARRLAENPDVSVLLLEAGGTDDVPAVMESIQWPKNLGSERDWNFSALPNPHLNGRAMPLDMGKVLGGGSSINLMAYSRGHKPDWDFFASEAGDPAWSYESVLNIFLRIEDWHGTPDPKYRGIGGPLYVQPTPNPNPVFRAMLEGARGIGIPTFEHPNGLMLEVASGAAIQDIRARDGKRLSVFRSYTFPYMDRPNLTVLTNATVLRLIIKDKRTTGVEISHNGKTHRIDAGSEVVLSLGAINTPKVLMQSGIGDQAELRRLRIPLVHHLPGVGQNFQDHVGFSSIWESEQTLVPSNTTNGAVLFSTSDISTESDIQVLLAEVPILSAETAAKYNPPVNCWTLFGVLVRPKSVGHLHLTGPNPDDPIQIDANTLSHPDDMKTAIACVELSREIGNSSAVKPYTRREVMPGNVKGAELEDFIRDATITSWHETCTAKMGRDAMSVVDGNLKVYGIENLRIADGSIMPRVTTGNTMAPCIIIGERASDILKKRHNL